MTSIDPVTLDTPGVAHHFYATLFGVDTAVKPALYRRHAPAEDVGISPAGAASHRLASGGAAEATP